MKDIEFTVSDIKDLMNTFSKNKLGGLKLSQGSFTLELKGLKAEQAAAAGITAAALSHAVLEASEPAEEKLRGNVVKSPIVGTFYAAPAPGKEPFVSVGQGVKRGDVLFIIESMKLMNEVTSDFDGTVGEIFVENGQTVEYGQPILTVE